MASATISRHSSSVLPWDPQPGSSFTRPIHHPSSGSYSIVTVNRRPSTVIRSTRGDVAASTVSFAERSQAATGIASYGPALLLGASPMDLGTKPAREVTYMYGGH